MFRKDRRERRGGGVILFIQESISTLTIGVVYRSPNIGQEEDVKLQKATREVSKGECVIMGDFKHGHIQWESLESAGGDDHQFLLLT